MKKTNTEEKKTENPKLGKEEMILGLFDDGIPKISKTLINLYAEKRGIQPNGGIHTSFTDLVNGNKLGKYKNFYGLIDWFDGKKMKKEYWEKTK